MEQNEKNMDDVYRRKEINIMHLSDLHFGIRRGDLAEREELVDVFFDDFERIDSKWMPDIIVITGDIGWNGKKEDYILEGDTRYKCFNNFISKLLEKTELGLEDFICCPGNHDKFVSDDAPGFHNLSNDTDVHLVGNASWFQDYSKFLGDKGMQPLKGGKEVAKYLYGYRSIKGVMVSTSDTYDEYETEYSDSIQAKLRNLVKRFVQKDLKVFGTADHYHNIAVTYAQKEMNDCACEILRVGIDDIPYAVDLIADYIHYGMLGGQRNRCEEMYSRLRSITRRRWNWRAYSFSIDYLLDKCKYINNESEQEKIKKEALELARQFIATEKMNREYLDQAYFDKAAIYAEFGDKKNEYRALEEGFNEKTSSSKCALRLADIAFSKGDYEDAIKKLKHCCNRIKPQPDIKGNYAYLLLALSKTTKLFDEENISQDKEEQVKSIYRDFYSALSSGLSGVYRETANTAIKIISAQTGVKCSCDDFTGEVEYDFY